MKTIECDKDKYLFNNISGKKIAYISIGYMGWISIKNSIFNRYKAYILISLLVLIIGIYNYNWVRQETVLNAFDMSGHLTKSLMYYDSITHPSASTPLDMVQLSGYYPPLVYIVTALAYIIFGNSLIVARMVSILFIFILVMSTFAIGQRLYNEMVGLIAAFLVSTYPVTIALVPEYMLDLPLSAMFSLFLLFLVLSDRFKDRKYTLALGLIAGLGMWTKWTFIIFMVSPILVILLSALWSHRLHIKGMFTKNKDTMNIVRSRAVNMLLAFTLFLLITLIWYIPNFSNYSGGLLFNIGDAISMRQDIRASTIPLLSYLFIMVNSQIYIPMFILFIIGVIFIFVNKDKNGYFLISCFIISYLLLSLIRNKDIRYTLPLLCYVAIISASWITKMRDWRISISIILCILVISPIQLIMAYNNIQIQSIPGSIDTPIGSLTLLPHNEFSLRHPINEDWHIEEIAQFIDSDNKKDGMATTALVSILPDNSYFAAPVFEYVARRDNLTIRPMGGYVWYPDIFLQDVKIAKYVITKDRYNASSQGLQRYEDIVVSTFNDNQANFTVIKRVSLPDGSNATIYKRI